MTSDRATSTAEQLAILADVCDAADPALTAERRITAAHHAASIDPEYAVEMAAELLRAFIESVRQVFGEDVAAGTMANVRQKAASLAAAEGDA